MDWKWMDLVAIALSYSSNGCHNTSFCKTKAVFRAKLEKKDQVSDI